MTLWRASEGFGTPAFIPDLHPFPAALIFLVAFVLSMGILVAFVRKTSRLVWAALSATLAATIFIVPYSPAALLLPIVAAVVVWAAVSGSHHWGPILVGVLAAAAFAALVAAPRWLPYRRLARELSRQEINTSGTIRAAVAGSEPIRILDSSGATPSLFRTKLLDHFRPLVHRRSGNWLIDSPAFDFLNISMVDGKRNPNALPRFFFVRSFAVEPRPDRAIEQLGKLDDFRVLATVDHIPAKTRHDSSGQLDRWPSTVLRGGALELKSYQRGAARLRVSSNGWNLLVSSEPWWEGWRVYWNDQRLPPVIVNAAFMGVFVPPGEGELITRFRPREYDAGLRLAALGLLGILVTTVYPWYFTIRSRGSLRDLLADTRQVADEVARPVGQAGNRVRAALATVRWTRLAPAAAIALLAIYASVLLVHRVDIAGGSDSSGYLNQARLWSRGGVVVEMEKSRQLGLPPQLAEVFAPLGFTPGQRPGTMVPTYPPGVPLHMMLLRAIGGDRAMFLFGPIAATVAVVLMYLFARTLGLAPGWSFVAACVLGLCPLFVFNGIQPVSDVAATAWSLVTIIAALRAGEAERGRPARRTARGSRANQDDSWKWGLVVGAAIGTGVLVRPTQILLLPAAAIAMRFRWRALVAMVLAGLPFAVFQMGLANHLYGHPFRSGYGPLDWLFAWSNFPPRFHHYSVWLARLFTPFIFPLGLGGLLARSVDRFIRAALAAWFVAFFVFYCFYSPYQDWGATRFLLPAAPAVIVLALMGATELLSRLRPLPRRATAVVLTAIVLGTLLQRTFDMGVLHAIEGQYVYREASRGAQRYLSKKSMVIAMELSGAYYYYVGEPAVNWASIDPVEFAALRAHIPGHKWYALISFFETPEVMKRAPGQWVPIARFRDVTLFELRER